MKPRRAVNRLKLGPIVGHTDHASTRIWIQVFDDPADYRLRVQGVDLIQFERTEAPGPLEFRTAIAFVTGLRPDWRYRYSVVRRGRVVLGAKGSFRTMPAPGSMASILFCPISCNAVTKDDREIEGAWRQFGKFVEDAKPHFVLMMGDQVYIDDDKPDIFHQHFDSPQAVRRAALAEKYRTNWSRDLLKNVLANVPTYMMWDDHEIRDGWGSLASDSATMLGRYPRGQDIFNRSNAYFEDARDVYWHFQGCRNPAPPPPIQGRPAPGERGAMPYVFQCGRLLVLALDSRGDRDAFRPEFPVLGSLQWQAIDQILQNLPEEIDALAVMTPTPIASMDPHGGSQKLVGIRTDDVEAFRRGDLGWFLHTPSRGGLEVIPAAIGSRITRLTGIPVNLGSFMVKNLDEARDQWSHQFARPEQAALIRKANTARFVNRAAGASRELLFVSGDIHVGCIFDIEMSDPDGRAVLLTSSGISALEDTPPTVGVIVDKSFDVADGIHSTLREVVVQFNFGVVQVIPTGTGAQILPAVVHEGTSVAWGIDVASLL